MAEGELQEQLKQLKDLIESNAKISSQALQAAQQAGALENKIDSSKRYIGWLQGVIGLIVIVVGLGINWGITKTKIEVLETKQATYETIVTTKIMKLEQDIHEIQLKQASSDPVIDQIKKDVTEIKNDVKKLRGVQ